MPSLGMFKTKEGGGAMRKYFKRYVQIALVIDFLIVMLIYKLGVGLNDYVHSGVFGFVSGAFLFITSGMMAFWLVIYLLTKVISLISGVIRS